MCTKKLLLVILMKQVSMIYVTVAFYTNRVVAIGKGAISLVDDYGASNILHDEIFKGYVLNCSLNRRVLPSLDAHSHHRVNESTISHNDILDILLSVVPS